MKVTVTGEACGAEVSEIDLTASLSDEVIAELRGHWLKHHVLVFRDQPMSDDDLERFTVYFGGFGDDTFIAPIEGRNNIIALRRDADETSTLFADDWHSDWSFQARPPAGTCLFGITIPPVGGDTLFVNQHEALRQMPDELRSRLEGKNAVHSARGAYAPYGRYGRADRDSGRTMNIVFSDEAEATQLHPVIRNHPETGVEGLFGCRGYIIGIEGLDSENSGQLIQELYDWQTSEPFQYRLRWRAGTLVMWDNRSLLHRATGGYEGHDRLLHRTTIRAV